MKLCYLLMLACLPTTLSAMTDDWPGWRGADRTDISTETGLLQEWPAGGPKRIWLNDAGGLGYSGFAVVGDRLFTLGLFDGNEYGLCLDATSGKELWRAKVGDEFKNGWGDGPRNTPTVDGNRVYFMSATGSLVCVELESGKPVWNTTMQEFGGEVPFWGFSESPLVDGDRLICTPGGKQGAMVALDKATGKKLWQTSSIQQTAHYSSPIVIENNKKRQYVQLIMDVVVGVDAETGDVLWQVPFPGKTAVIPTPVLADGQIYVTAGYSAGSSLISLSDDQSATEVWHSRSMSNHHGGVIYMDGHIYGHSDREGFSCQNVKTGELVWSEKEQLKKGAVTFADNRFYFIEEQTGDVVLFSASPEGWDQKGRFEFSPKSEQRHPRGAIWVHPVIANGKLYLRDQENICCYDISK